MITLELTFATLIASACLAVSLCAPVSEQSCEQAVDMVFLVDTSSSIHRSDYSHVKQFINNVVNTFKVGPGPKDSRVGVLLFSHHTFIQFYLRTYMTNQDVQKAVNRVRFRSGETYTHKGLKLTSRIMLAQRYGARPGVPKVLVVLTDGKSADEKKTVKEAQKLKNMGVDIFAIGVGAESDDEELRAMASTPADHYAFNVINYKALDTIKKTVTRSTCLAASTTTTVKTTTTEPTTTTTVPTTATTTRPETELKQKDGPDRSWSLACKDKPADIYFLLDSSSSVYIVDFRERVLKFVRDLVTTFHISPMHTRVGLVTFSNQVKHEFGLADHSNLESLREAIQPDTVEYLTGGTNTWEAIQFVTRKAFSSSVARTDVPQVIISITDGLSQKPRKTAKAAAEARRRGVTMFAIGVGKDVDKQELKDISSNPDEQFVFYVENFKALASITEQLAQKTCSVVAQGTAGSLNRTHDKDTSCSDRPTSVVFTYTYLNSIAASRAIVQDVITQFTSEAHVTAPHMKIGVVTQPCIGGSTSIMAVGRFQRAMSQIKSNYFMGYPGVLRKVRKEIFNNVPVTDNRISVMFVDERTRNSEHLQREALNLRLKNIRVIVVAVGQVDESLVKQLASLPYNQNVYRIDSYAALKEHKLPLIGAICKRGGQQHSELTLASQSSVKVENKLDLGGLVFDTVETKRHDAQYVL